MAINDPRTHDRRNGTDTPAAGRTRRFRDLPDRFHKRAMDLTLLLFRGRAGIVFTVLEVLYFVLLFYAYAEGIVTPVRIFFATTLNILFVGLFICLLSRAVFHTLQQERRLTEASIEEVAHRSELDALTGLYHRGALFDQLSAHLRRTAGRQEPLSVILFDLDNFKEVNDRCGHAVGDVCLTQLADILREEGRSAELAARYGGEEFVLVLPGCGLRDAAARAEAVRRRVAGAAFGEAGAPLALTVSAGVAEWRDGMDAAALVDLADRRMYAAKEAGRDRTNAGPELDASALPEPAAPLRAEARTSPPLSRSRRKRALVEDVGEKQELFLLFLQQSLYGVGIWLVLTLFLSRSLPAFLAYLVPGLLTLLLHYLLRRSRGQKAVRRLYVLYTVLFGLVFLPLMYLFCGGLGSGVPILFILEATIITLLLNGAFAGTMLFLLTAVSFFVIGFDLTHDGLVAGFTDLGDLIYFYTLATILFVGVTLSRVMRMLYRNYLENRKFSDVLMEQLKASSIIDPLSGAYDRRFLLDYLGESIRLAETGELSVFSVLMFDLDHFKLINDRYGHLTGDECIRSLARLVGSRLRKDDVLIRYGGEEFICVLRGASDYTAVRRAEQIRAEVEATSLSSTLTEPVTLSCGVVMYRPGMTPDDLIREADTQLYRAKRRGRNRVACRGSLAE